MKQYQVVAVMQDGSERISEFDESSEGFDDKLLAKAAAAQLLLWDDKRMIVSVKVLDVQHPIEIDGVKVPKVVYSASRD